MTIRFSIALALLPMGHAMAQQLGSGGYTGPGVLSRGAQGVGERGGQQVSLRFSAGVNGVYQTGLVPLSLDSNGRLLNLGGLAGVEAVLGAYGTHNWSRATLGLDYSGNYRYFPKNTYFSGSQQTLRLGYSHQKSRRLGFDIQTQAGTIQYSTGLLSSTGGRPDIADPTTGLFDNRYNFLQSGLTVNYQASARTTFSGGGYAFTVRRQNRQLASVNGYSLRGTAQRRLSQRTVIAASYDYLHFDYSQSFGESDIHSYTGMLSRAFGPAWRLEVQGGAYTAEVQGLQSVALDPGLAAFLGVSTGVRTFYRKTTAPTGTVVVTRQFRSAVASANYSRLYNPGNGIFLTSNSESAGVNASYTGIRRWSFSLNGSVFRMKSIGQDLQGYQGVQASAGVTRALTDSLHLVIRVDKRLQQLSQGSFRRWSDIYTLGFSYSPGTVPLSLW